MKKSILLLGQQGAGKTTKLKEILSNYKADKVAILTFKSFNYFSKNELEKYEVVVVEETYSVEQLETIAKAECENFFVVTTQLALEELSECVLSTFEIFNCNAGL
jgi:ABC-type multidrug transport system ATPase subunit